MASFAQMMSIGAGRHQSFPALHPLPLACSERGPAYLPIRANLRGLFSLLLNALYASMVYHE